MTELRITFFIKICWFVILARLRGIRLLPTSFIRTDEEQARLFEAGASDCDGVHTRSKHQDGRAIDFVIYKDGKTVWPHVPEYDTLGKIWRRLGGTWGGDWKNDERDDVYHFEL